MYASRPQQPRAGATGAWLCVARLALDPAVSSDDHDVEMKARTCTPAKNWGVAKAVEENADIITIYLFYLIPKGLGNWL